MQFLFGFCLGNSARRADKNTCQQWSVAPLQNTRRKAKAEVDMKAEPLCKFGPGGDFIAAWQPTLSESSSSSNWLTKVLTFMLEPLALLLGLKPSGPSAHAGQAVAAHEFTARDEQRVPNGVRNIRVDRTFDAAPTATAAADCLFSGQPSLFPDHRRVGLRIRHKPQHRVRTYRRTAKKRPALWLPEQGSLFEIDLASARTA